MIGLRVMIVASMNVDKQSQQYRRLVVAPILLAAAVTVVLMIWIGGLFGGGVEVQPNTDFIPRSYQFLWPVQSMSRPRDGTFLIAARNLQDPNFAHTVVLLIDYDSRGAFGLIIDRPTSHTLAALWPEITGLDAHFVYFGGPVFPNRLLFLLKSDDAPKGVRQVIPGAHLGSDELILKRIIATGEEEFRVYAGYSSWAPGQLDNEIARGAWHIIPAERRFIFDPQPAEVWPELIQRVDIQVVKLSQ
jgi:putative transcriptional regulator